MIKETCEEPEVIKNTVRTIPEKADEISKDLVKKKGLLLYIIGSGSSYYEAVAGERTIEALAKIPTKSMWPCEFAYYPPPPGDASVVIAISRSGETTDVIEAVNVAERLGMEIIGITNTPGSTLVSRSIKALIPPAGEEKSVVVTKTYTSHVLTQYLLAISMAKAKGLINKDECDSLLAELSSISDIVKNFLDNEDKKVKELASTCLNSTAFFVLGSGYIHSTALEGSLKIKETSHVPSEGYTIPGFLHGPIGLVERDRPVIVLFPPKDSGTWSKAVKVAKRVKDIGGTLIGVACEREGQDVSKLCNEVMLLPGSTREIFRPLGYIAPLHLLAYYICIGRGLNPDEPRYLTWYVK